MRVNRDLRSGWCYAEQSKQLIYTKIFGSEHLFLSCHILLARKPYLGIAGFQPFERGVLKLTSVRTFESVWNISCPVIFGRISRADLPSGDEWSLWTMFRNRSSSCWRWLSLLCAEREQRSLNQLSSRMTLSRNPLEFREVIKCWFKRETWNYTLGNDFLPIYYINGLLSLCRHYSTDKSKLFSILERTFRLVLNC